MAGWEGVALGIKWWKERGFLGNVDITWRLEEGVRLGIGGVASWGRQGLCVRWGISVQGREVW